MQGGKELERDVREWRVGKENTWKALGIPSNITQSFVGKKSAVKHCSLIFFIQCVSSMGTKHRLQPASILARHSGSLF